MEYIAHIRVSDGERQALKTHLLGVKKLAEMFGATLGIMHITGLAGMLHDLGKYTVEFQNYLIEAVNHPEAPPKRGSVDHSTAGGRMLYDLYHKGKIEREKGILAEIIGNAIISHHSYLHDYLNPELESPYLRRVRDKVDIGDYDECVRLFFQQVMDEAEFQLYVECAAQELKQYLTRTSSFNMEAKCMFLSKFVFSALIDADRTNTRCFEDHVMEEEVSTGASNLFQGYYEKLMNKLQDFAQGSDSGSVINKLRSEMSEQCDRFADKPSRIYTLSIPTGGGKTLASLRYALKHAATFGKKHVIYVLPYTTIIEQNAAEVRQILQDDIHILEHHSNVTEETVDDDEAEDGLMNIRQKLKLAKDNWESPIIFTTMVQFLNVFYAKGSGNTRRLHNLTESVIIFDEVQKVPVSCVSLFNEALNFLKDFGRSSIVLCTATQPALDFVEHRLQIDPDAEMIQDIEQVVASFKRVEIIDEASSGLYTNEKLADFALNKLEEEKRNILIILNTKTVVKDLYQRIKNALQETPVYHLSTSMCAAHRKQILGKIRDHLQKKEQIVCISTPLIEAGVDVSFECVIRSLAGLDSIAQAAGRCNRHGEEVLQQVYVIDHVEENLDHLKEIKQGKEITKRMLIDLQRDTTHHGGHLLSKQAMTHYFQRFYLDVKPLLNFDVSKLAVNMTTLLFAGYHENKYYQDYCENYRQVPPLFLVNSYRTAAEHFHVIDDLTTPVIVPFGEGREIIAELNGAERIEDFGKLMRKAQQYTINIFSYEMKKLDKNNGLDRCLDGQILVLKDGAYNEEYGLDQQNDSWTGGYFFG